MCDMLQLQHRQVTLLAIIPKELRQMPISLERNIYIYTPGEIVPASNHKRLLNGIDLKFVDYYSRTIQKKRIPNLGGDGGGISLEHILVFKKV